jgi:hypothetical protein
VRAKLSKKLGDSPARLSIFFLHYDIFVGPTNESCEPWRSISRRSSKKTTFLSEFHIDITNVSYRQPSVVGRWERVLSRIA